MGDINWFAWLVPLARRGEDACGDCEDARSFRLTSAEVVLSWEVGSDSVGSSLLPSETKRFSRPSTRFKRASRTSVLGPLFLGTASGSGCQSMFGCTRVVLRVEHTVYTRAVEHLTGFTGRACAIALDLEFGLARGHDEKKQTGTTFRFRQLLQFMASRGSLETRRAGSRSMPICGLAIAASDWETSVDMATLQGGGPEAFSGCKWS